VQRELYELYLNYHYRILVSNTGQVVAKVLLSSPELSDWVLVEEDLQSLSDLSETFFITGLLIGQ